MWGGKYKNSFNFFCAIKIGLEDNKKVTSMNLPLTFSVFVL